MLKLYLNENLSWRIARALREYGYDVISSHEALMDQTDDPAQFTFAVEHERAGKNGDGVEIARFQGQRLVGHQATASFSGPADG